MDEKDFVSFETAKKLKEAGFDYPCSYYTSMEKISDILDRHDKMIREEIDAEIEKLKKEIGEL